MEKDPGTAEAGKMADVVSHDGDPAENSGNANSIHPVMQNGRLNDGIMLGQRDVQACALRHIRRATRVRVAVAGMDNH
ncbi:MAG: hypothetical protein WBQ26_05095 [Gemmatimonadaceae bacterium]